MRGQKNILISESIIGVKSEDIMPDNVLDFRRKWVLNSSYQPFMEKKTATWSGYRIPDLRSTASELSVGNGQLGGTSSRALAGSFESSLYSSLQLPRGTFCYGASAHRRAWDEKSVVYGRRRISCRIPLNQGPPRTSVGTSRDLASCAARTPSAARRQVSRGRGSGLWGCRRAVPRFWSVVLAAFWAQFWGRPRWATLFSSHEWRIVSSIKLPVRLPLLQCQFPPGDVGAGRRISCISVLSGPLFPEFRDGGTREGDIV